MTKNWRARPWPQPTRRSVPDRVFVQQSLDALAVWQVFGQQPVATGFQRGGHLVAFNLAFEAMGLPWRWSADYYGPLLHVTGGHDRLLHDMAQRPDASAGLAERQALARELHLRKNALYAAQAAGIACSITRSAFFVRDRYPGAAWARPDPDAPTAMTLDTIRQCLSVKISPS